MVLFLFALMLLNLGPEEEAGERQWLRLRSWLLPSVLAAVLLAQLVYMLASDGLPGAAGKAPGAHGVVEAKAVGVALFGPYLLVIELASVLLLAGLVATHRLTREDPERTDLEEEGS